MAVKKLKKDALGSLAYERIKQMISDGALGPGERIGKQELADTLGVSQTPVSEAINRLAGEGLIEQRERAGYFIKTFSYEDLNELFAVRAALEGISLRLAVEQLPQERLDELGRFFQDFELPLDERQMTRYLKEDKAFHEKIVEFSDNSVIINFERSFDFVLKSYSKGLIRPPEQTLEEHRAIIRAVMSRNAEAAQELVMQHDLKSRDVIRRRHLRT